MFLLFMSRLDLVLGHSLAISGLGSFSGASWSLSAERGRQAQLRPRGKFARALGLEPVQREARSDIMRYLSESTDLSHGNGMSWSIQSPKPNI